MKNKLAVLLTLALLLLNYTDINCQTKSVLVDQKSLHGCHGPFRDSSKFSQPPHPHRGKTILYS